MRISALGLVLVFATASTARADVLPPEDDGLDCPGGSEKRTCHAGSYCGVDICETDADCETGACEEQRLCLGAVDCSGGDPNPANVPDARECTDGCCETLRACTDGCGCQVVGADNPSGAWATLLLVAAASSRRRRRDAH